MSKADHNDLPDLVKTANPLPWTTGGPNDHLKPPQTASNLLTVSVVDPVYYLKQRVITMKQLEAIKKRLPRGIDVRINSKKVLSFRVRFRKKGYPDQTKTFPEEKFAKQWLAEQERNALMGIHFPQVRASEHTLAEAIDRYFTEELPRKPRNAKNVRQHLERFRQELGDYALSAIRPSLINEKRVILENEIIKNGNKRSPTTVLRYLTSLSHLLTVAVKDWEWLLENPMDKVTKPKPAPGRQRYLTEEERKALLTEAQNSRCPVLYPILVLALSTGMRRGEIMNLRKENIDLPNETIKLSITKNDEPRLVPLKGLAHRLITSIYEKLTYKESLLFPSPSNPLNSYDIETAWKGALKRANITGFRFHDNRHSNASIHAAKGRSLLEIGRSLGHKSLQTTKRYAHLTYEHTTKMVEELDQEIFGDKHDNL